MKIAVYTCVTGGYDHVSAPYLPDPRIEYHCYTDRPEGIPAPWQVHSASLPRLSAKDINRFIKMHPHHMKELQDCDLTIYVDGSIDIIGDVQAFADECMQSPAQMFVYEHPLRDCTYDEARACASFGHAPVTTLQRQMSRYRCAGLPVHAGLYECNVLVRRRSPAVAQAMEAWWEEYLGNARRDQLSFTYVAWKHALQVHSLGPSDPRHAQRFFRLKDHARAGFSPRLTATKCANLALLTTGLARLPA